jgi:uncharacterized membrane protein
MRGSVQNWVRRRFITGFFVTVPAFATAWLLWIFWAKIDDLFDPLYRAIFGRSVAGLGFLTAVLIIFIMGVIATNVVGRRVVALADRLIMRVPVYRRLYAPVKQLIESFSPEKRSSFKEVVLAQHPREGEFVFGFVTSEVVVEGPDGKRDMVTVFVPTNNLYLGDLVVLPRDQVIPTGLNIEDAIRIILSAGTATPARIPRPSDVGRGLDGPAGDRCPEGSLEPECHPGEAPVAPGDGCPASFRANPPSTAPRG